MKDFAPLIRRRGRRRTDTSAGWAFAAGAAWMLVIVIVLEGAL